MVVQDGEWLDETCVESGKAGTYVTQEVKRQLGGRHESLGEKEQGKAKVTSDF